MLCKLDSESYKLFQIFWISTYTFSCFVLHFEIHFDLFIAKAKYSLQWVCFLFIFGLLNYRKVWWQLASDVRSKTSIWYCTGPKTQYLFSLMDTSVIKENKYMRIFKFASSCLPPLISAWIMVQGLCNAVLCILLKIDPIYNWPSSLARIILDMCILFLWAHAQNLLLKYEFAFSRPLKLKESDFQGSWGKWRRCF